METIRVPSWKVIKKAMKGNIIIDGRNILIKNELTDEGFIYKELAKQILFMTYSKIINC